MNRTLKLIHFIALALFLGSILAWIVLSETGPAAPPALLAQTRWYIHIGTWALTVPGLWLMLISGLLLGYRRYGPRNRFFQLKLGLTLVILLNASFVVAPAVDQAYLLAQAALPASAVGADFHAATLREAIGGGLNILLIVITAAVGVWRPGVRARAAGSIPSVG
ncbi:hypothetical protein HNO92_004229 [Chromobacterium alkanivorans]|uniref:hypothetical protein n=1 Tax=Chromobacterium alkanivorans TaxID=1071719 RepID=UPI002166E953|nr:hypothetical protein [Chromobacterium alkanivorans]MCS3806620.1 hypothetical protein [Chromobacterium alkanivorans]MCS3820958.1 hypothetical protein [Chromobacterium alkanivorans]MCS3875880.1 hypothetical protein [Chromobacterium alkanivorans]